MDGGVVHGRTWIRAVVPMNTPHSSLVQQDEGMLHVEVRANCLRAEQVVR